MPVSLSFSQAVSCLPFFFQKPAGPPQIRSGNKAQNIGETTPCIAASGRTSKDMVHGQEEESFERECLAEVVCRGLRGLGGGIGVE